MLGVYSISPGTIEFARVPANLTKKRGRYDVPVFRLRCVAVDRSVQGQGLGGDLLLASRERALAVASQVGGVALTIDAKDTKRRAGTSASALCFFWTTRSNSSFRSTSLPM